MSDFEIGGVFCAATTAVTTDGRPDFRLFIDHCRKLLDEGCHGIALLGTTGEANSFGLKDRMEILDRAIAGGIRPEQLLPGTAQSAVADTIELTRHAIRAGVRGVVMLPPFYYKGVSAEGIYRAYARIIESVGDDRLRIVLYHIPQVSGVAIPHEVVGRLREDFPGIVVGIKDSSGDLENMKAIVKTFPDFGVLAGADPLLLPLLEAGGAGCITASSNLVAAELRLVFDNWNVAGKETEVKAAQEKIVAWRELTNAYVQLPTVKALVARRRGDNGWLRVNPPLVELTDAERDAVWARMTKLEQA
ncbi:dihydrodipicolinate synthase family protein [Sinorhizobium sp. 8-89]|uniref:dihydrodipicolinate synthase family protein n=1 Tax=Sinorhizobium sp. 7-81 TaxID=3049087 RepID=UPI0024C3ED71|nr:dihydrodipicolinate synthase family protein [Sinorhizobium sp. 7-81]MDK1386019.1 dihydrodipicolinate synthase family protein [Sinorhizobium sp. 7-81]